ncbi:MAG: 7-carboxy-7-deazaguanine synthase QueE [Bacteroidota bacterium]
MSVLPVMESFYSLQGEGVFRGTPAYFIRIAGCDVGCTWCDVKESWDAEKYNEVEVTELANKVVDSGTKIAVITGGEPLMYKLDSLTDELRNKGIDVHLETSGSYPLSGDWDWICVSPKKFKAPLPDVLSRADELKIIVVNKHDLEWGEEQARLTSLDCRFLLQPEWSKSDQVLPFMIDYVKANPQWSISLQEHKYINIP